MLSRKHPPADAQFEQRLKLLVRDKLDAAAEQDLDGSGAPTRASDVMGLLIELRTAARRGSEPVAAARIGPEFSSYLKQFYALPAELQPSAIDAMVKSRRHEEDGDVAAAIQVCESATDSCPAFPALYERLARLEATRGDKDAAERWYCRLLTQLGELELLPRGLEISCQLVQSGISSPELLEECGRRLEAGGELNLAAACWSTRARQFLAADSLDEALRDMDHAFGLQPQDPHLCLELGLVYEQLGEVDRAANTQEQAQRLAADSPEALGRVLVTRARVQRPDEEPLARLMDLLELRPSARATALQSCGEAVANDPYNPHLCYLRGVLLAHDGQIDEGIAALRTAANRYSAQSDHESELQARLAIQQLTPGEEENSRRVAELHFECGDVRDAMKVLSGLAQAAHDAAAHTPGQQSATQGQESSAAGDEHSSESDYESELEARRVVQELAPWDEGNGRRVAELHFKRGEVHDALQALSGLARAAARTKRKTVREDSPSAP
jgi:tetratricopeptide (TPR) repeat protein